MSFKPEGWYLFCSDCNEKERGKLLDRINRMNITIIGGNRNYIKFNATYPQAEELVNNTVCSDGLMSAEYPLSDIYKTD